jgi:hypothetical protein
MAETIMNICVSEYGHWIESIEFDGEEEKAEYLPPNINDLPPIIQDRMVRAIQKHTIHYEGPGTEE